jgi:fermentation-respiration switch protein FrsA (DUF1100 family)
MRCNAVDRTFYDAINVIVYNYIYKFGLLIAFLAVLFFLIRYLEKKNLYFPLKTIEANPGDIGLYYEDIIVTTGDGVDINLWYIPADRPAATIIFCHGNGGNISHRLEKIRLLNGIGLNVLIFDYRGYGSSGGSPSEEGLYLDASAVFGYLVNIRMVPSDRLILYGESLGAAVAIDLAGKYDVAGIIIEGGFSSVKEMAKRIFPFVPGFIYKSRFDSLSGIRNVNVPKLFFHAGEDEIVPLELGRKIYDAASGPKEFVQINGGHNDSFLVSEEMYLREIESFTERYGLTN